MIIVKDLGAKLEENALSVNRASEISGISRKVIDKAIRGEAIRSLSFAKLSAGLLKGGYDISSVTTFGRDDRSREAVSGNVSQMPGTERQDVSNQQMTPAIANSEGVDFAKRLDALLRYLVECKLEGEKGFREEVYDSLIYYTNEAHRHAQQLSGDVVSGLEIGDT